EGFGIGFGGLINTEVTINNNKITDIRILNHSETAGYYEEVFRELAYEITETQNLNLDAISGATSTCRGFLNSLKDAVNKSLAD
ncbi:MAG TPA: FMN-binding protein, partial [Sedimentibacter sp.]|nr:FMN-binding protein [Sedimentibacter sp.]